MKYFAELSNSIINIMHDVTDDELRRFSSLAKMFGKIEYDIDRIDIVKKSFDEMINAFNIENVEKEQRIDNDINRLVMNYLFAFRVFLDHWETYIKRDWSADKSYVCTQIIANLFEYKFVYTNRRKSPFK